MTVRKSDNSIVKFRLNAFKSSKIICFVAKFGIGDGLVMYSRLCMVGLAVRRFRNSAFSRWPCFAADANNTGDGFDRTSALEVDLGAHFSWSCHLYCLLTQFFCCEV